MFVNLSVIKAPDLSLTKVKMRDSIKTFNELAESSKSFPIRVVIPWDYMCSAEVDALINLLDKAGWVISNIDKDIPAKHTVYFISPKVEHILEQVQKYVDESK